MTKVAITALFSLAVFALAWIMLIAPARAERANEARKSANSCALLYGKDSDQCKNQGVN